MAVFIGGLSIAGLASRSASPQQASVVISRSDTAPTRAISQATQPASAQAAPSGPYPDDAYDPESESGGAE